MLKKGSYFYYALANGMFYFSWGMFACIISVYLAGSLQTDRDPLLVTIIIKSTTI